MFKTRFSLVGMILILVLVVSAITRLLLFASTHASNMSFGQLLGAFIIGFIYDCTVASFVIIPFVLQLWLQTNIIYRKKVMPYVVAFFMSVLALLLFTHVVPKDYSKELFRYLIIYIVLRFAIYLVLFFSSQGFRIRWRAGVLYAATTLVVFLILLNGVSEWFFWQEFSTRYNFIAVDYLVYTTEVLGNIGESYPIIPIVGSLVLAAVLLVYLNRRFIRYSVCLPSSFAKRTLMAIFLLLLPVLGYFVVQEKWRNFSRNAYANALAGNGPYEFAEAFMDNELDFCKFYQTMPDTEAFRLVRAQIQTPNARFVNNNPYSIERDITYAEPERKLNVVLISVESFSASFMRAFGSDKNITPALDSLAKHSLFFTNMFASGTRTVRGLEALSLSIPPTPGQSIVKRPDNGHLFSLGSVFRAKGYITQYIYGGYSYFDNMKAFFSNNGYAVIDRSAIPAAKVHYENIWGVADEDLFTLALHMLDSNHQAGKPFFTHIMTVSNHRPYTYPDGRIDIPAASQTREGAVKYTDYSIVRFIKEAAAKPWFDSTVFVIVADHCASAAGHVELPVTGYHIPMMIYAPKILPSRNVSTLTAQIDVAPTILGLLNFNYRSKFFGQDVLHLPEGKERAFISTYQGLGYLKDGTLIIQSPVKQVHSFKPDFTNGNAISIPLDPALRNEAIAYYQSINWILKHKQQSE
ncbi:Phosphoglycerol transferase MdoB [Chitinophaga costaii]|uniref:Phosphoglycerol transferase MdoB n=1 Tax=Chitinophaga costaii TaxID=1335309 RepID=A0A1C4BD64_9BACT|nr:LTA synthase family protein [Chitinophaga costaii]PUZ27654.1 sulfatase [Chitinophaga costaii]SCC04825.1 Phosphoglycerol transferase MdoB [Chitinophaga costaii]